MIPKSLALVLAAALFASLTLVACGSSGGTETTTVVTVIKEVSSDTSDDAPADSIDASDSSSDSSSSDSSSEKITVPDVVGMDHQDAQNKMQDVGLFNLDEEDATGEGRMLILDHNWEVVEQKPVAGSEVSEDTTILLISKKKGE